MALDIGIIALPHLRRAADLQPLLQHPTLSCELQPNPTRCHLLILPDSGAIISDLNWLQRQDWPEAIQAHLQKGGKLLGLGAGYQLLGQAIADPIGLHGDGDSHQALALLQFASELRPEKPERPVSGVLATDQTRFSAIEAQSGITQGIARNFPACYLYDQPEGVLSLDGQIMGSSLHALPRDPNYLEALLRWANLVQSTN